MSRTAYETESPSALIRHLLNPHSRAWVFGETHNGAIILCNTYNDATAPNVFRSDEEHNACRRIAFICQRIRANHYGSRRIQTGSDGAWFTPSR